MKNRMRIAFAIATMAACTAVVAPATASASTHDPILFVHGWNSNTGVWDTMKGRFAAAGWSASELNTISYGGSSSNATIANSIKTKVGQILAANPGKTKVDLISHSMGGLSTRYYVKNLGGATKVDDFVSLGGPNHGTTLAVACALVSVQCREMSPGSSFLNALNSGDETPGTPNYATWWSTSDAIILPQSSTPLAGAVNTQVSGLSHGELTTDANVHAGVQAFVN